MRRVLLGGLAASLSLVGVPALPVSATVAAPATVVYDATVTPLPPNMPSLGYQATQTAEFGDAVTLAGTERALRSATITFSTWAKHSEWPSYPDAGWTWPVTVNVYGVDNDGSTPAVGDLLGTTTSTVAVPWRPEDTDACPAGKWSPMGAEGTDCYSGKAFNAEFDLSALSPVPDDVIVTVAFNTQSWGASPVGVAGPYNSLNVALRDTTSDGPVPAGTDTDPDAVFWDTEFGAFYTDDGAGGVGTLRQDTGWSPHTPAIALTAFAGECQFTQSGSTLTLQDDCTTDETISVPVGFTMDGDGHTITAVDPDAGHFIGPVLTNAGTGGDVSIRDVTVTASGLANVCDDASERLRGILLDGVGGSIENTVVTGVRQGTSGCQEGNAIEVRNFTAGGGVPTTKVVVTVSANTVGDYQKNGITINGGTIATVTGNSVTGDGPVDYIAQNGIQIGYGATASVQDNVVSGNSYTGVEVACGLLMYDAAGVKQKKNTLADNEKSVCNFGRGGGQVTTSP